MTDKKILEQIKAKPLWIIVVIGILLVMGTGSVAALSLIESLLPLLLIIGGIFFAKALMEK